MSFRTICDRHVDVHRRDPDVAVSVDAYGNDPHDVLTVVETVPARRNLSSNTEDRTDRDQQTETWLYYLDLRTVTGRPVATLSGRDLIVDGTETFEIVGDPWLAARRRRPHHWEAYVRRVEG